MKTHKHNLPISLLFIISILMVILLTAIVSLVKGNNRITAENKGSISTLSQTNTGIKNNTLIDLPVIKAETFESKDLSHIKKKIATMIYDFKSKENTDSKVRQYMLQQINGDIDEYIRFYNAENLYKYYFNKPNPDNVFTESALLVVSKMGRYSNDEKYIFRNTGGNYTLEEQLDIPGQTDSVEVSDNHIIINSVTYSDNISQGKSYVVMNIDDHFKIVWSGTNYVTKNTFDRNQKNEDTPTADYTYGGVRVYFESNAASQKGRLLLQHYTFQGSDSSALSKTSGTQTASENRSIPAQNLPSPRFAYETYVMDKTECMFVKE